MEFRTTIPIQRAPFSISHSKPTLLIGSCFTENIGRIMRQELFPVTVNPAGVLYNPASIAKSLQRVLDRRHIRNEELITHDGVYHSMEHHSSFSSTDPEKVVDTINRNIDQSHDALYSAGALIVTFGTATAYRYRPTGEIAGNCHKIPQQEFETLRLTVDEIVETWEQTIERILNINHDIKFIFTVSPIRYKAYGMHGSQLDKATLLMALDRITTAFSKESVYFPAYEIMLDDLRDYRFYDPDMIHPSQQAVEYIYESFRQTFYNDTTIQLAKKCCKITRRLTHRFIVDDKNAIDSFNSETQQIINRLETEHPNIKQLAINFAKWHHSVQ